MKSLRPSAVYVETTVWIVGAAEAPRDSGQQENQLLLERCRDRFIEPFISDLVLVELSELEAPKRTRALALVQAVKPGVLCATPEARQLAERYLETKLFAPSCGSEALHLAIATVANVDLLTSWDFGRLVSMRAQDRIRLANACAGYKAIECRYPAVLMYEGDDDVE